MLERTTTKTARAPIKKTTRSIARERSKSTKVKPKGWLKVEAKGKSKTTYARRLLGSRAEPTITKGGMTYPHFLEYNHDSGIHCKAYSESPLFCNNNLINYVIAHKCMTVDVRNAECMPTAVRNAQCMPTDVRNAQCMPTIVRNAQCMPANVRNAVNQFHASIVRMHEWT